MNMATAILTSALFFSVAAVIISYFAFRHHYLSNSLKALQSAIDKGSQLTPALANMLEMRSDLRRGMVSLARALACVLLGVAIQVSPATAKDAADAQAAMWFLIGIAAFPGLFGFVLIGFHLSSTRSKY